ncbi:MAG TPA: glutamate synthase subunit beta, partial [Candidatus Omnitrophota bacterium]|nr:glutamate synthase subunit beta [Candidatus Omnitrophota bacterium]
MADPKGFLKFKRAKSRYRAVAQRVQDFKEVEILRKEDLAQEQAARCMDCGIPFCHWGCPIGNVIPEWNDALYRGQWQKAVDLLHATNNFPEITGRLCPAPCEHSCVLNINDDPVTIRENELSIVEHAFQAGLIKPVPPKVRTGKKVAVVGSGPAGLACADQLNKAGHEVTVFERDEKIGGIMRLGIPDFKLEKWVLDRRIGILEKEGIQFKTGVNVGGNYAVSRIKKEFDAVCLAGGSRAPRDLTIPGRDLAGIHFAMDFLMQNNRRVGGASISEKEQILAKGKRVVVIGGGDTGADCVGSSHRQGALSVTQLEVLPRPPESRADDCPWPKYAFILKTSTSHEEGGDRHWSVMTKKFTGEKGQVSKLSCARLEWSGKDAKGCPLMREISGSEFEIEADLVLLAIGFLHPEHPGLLSSLGVEFDARGNVKTNADYMTSIPGVFS